MHEQDVCTSIDRQKGEFLKKENHTGKHRYKMAIKGSQIGGNASL